MRICSKKTLILLTTGLFILSSQSFANPQTAAAATPATKPVPTAKLPTKGPARPTVPAEPTLSSNSFILIDFNSNKVIAQRDVDKRVEPASLTKMMTMYVVDKEIEAGKLKLDDMVTISKKAWEMPGSRMFVQVGSQVKVEDLIQGVIVQSGNDSSVALAEHIAGTENGFADLMNAYAKEIGMNNSHFMNATGLPDPQHYTTAKDMAQLGRALIRDFPKSYERYSQKWFVYQTIKQPNRNRLLWRDPSIDGIKTGHTDNAGYCLVSSAKKGDMRLVSVVLGAKDDNTRTEESYQLLSYGFRFFETHKLFTKDKVLNTARIWMGDKPSLNLGLKEDIYVTIPQGQYNALDAKLQIDKQILAPVDSGKSMGKVLVSLNSEVLAEQPIISLDTVNTGGAWSRLTDYIKLNWAKVTNKVDEATPQVAATPVNS